MSYSGAHYVAYYATHLGAKKIMSLGKPAFSYTVELRCTETGVTATATGTGATRSSAQEAAMKAAEASLNTERYFYHCPKKTQAPQWFTVVMLTLLLLLVGFGMDAEWIRLKVIVACLTVPFIMWKVLGKK